MGIASKEGTVLQLFRRRHRKNKIIGGEKNEKPNIPYDFSVLAE